MSLPMDKSKTQKRRNAPATKARILAAAQKAFSELGYSEIGIRNIAGLAGVDSAMLLRYFGSKAGLFEAALIDAMFLNKVLGSDRKHFGEAVTDVLLGAQRIEPTSIMALAAAHPEARDITIRVTRERILTPLAKWLGAPRGNVRAVQTIVLAQGFVLRAKIGLIPISKSADRDLAAWFAQTIQAIVDQSTTK
jgi:AcrR family transcriptional regulator